MRLSPAQCETIKASVTKVIGPMVNIWLFGSRTRDDERGGDIDLFVQAENLLANRVASACQIAAELQRQLGDQRIDVIVADPATPTQPIHQIAMQSGIKL